jgi:hypothetical protein
LTESEWLACTDPGQMLESLRGKASDRKSRLFACACCRGMWEFLTDERGRRAVEIAERLADGRATPEELAAARSDVAAARAEAEAEANRGMNAMFHGDLLWFSSLSARRFATRAAVEAAADLSWEAAAAAVENYLIVTSSQCISHLEARWWGWDRPEADAKHDASIATARRVLCDVIRDVFGDPARSVSIDPRWLSWSDGRIPQLAQDIYEERAFDRLTILGDALEEAGCIEALILTHCDDLGAHARGCWVIDALLGKT